MLLSIIIIFINENTNILYRFVILYTEIRRTGDNLFENIILRNQHHNWVDPTDLDRNNAY